MNYSIPTKDFSKGIKNFRETVNKDLQRQAMLHENLKFEERFLEQSQGEQEVVRNCQDILQTVAQEVEKKAHEHISRIVSKCLQMVFDDPYTFEIDFVRKRNTTEAVIQLSKDGMKLDPMDSTGGGVVDIAAFALRMACLSLRVPKDRAFIVLDEPMKHVSPDLRPRIAAMFEMLAEELGFQFLLSTHMKSLRLGTVVELGQ